MAGRIYSADGDKLRDHVGRMNDRLDTASAAYSSLLNDCEAIGGAWSGAAADEFMQRLTEITARLDRLMGDIRSFADDLKGASDEFDRADDDIAQIVAAMTVG